ncbi:protein PF14_0175-like isoform X3 [Maniola jurtina]|uniref:protein PF14_0175-like isoform X3 n=1 Tax=Maniola jurtina TaxID=191418 RepID=UPI001E687D82|nr:protein PF14_0175-like isoform X3 [Maniola jurtina]
MPRRRKQHWNDLNPGSQRYNRQNPYNSYQSFQRNTGQTFNNSYSNQANFTPGVGYYYDNSAFQTNYPQNYSNNYYDPSFQRNFPQNRNQSHFNQNYQTNFNQNARNTDYNPNFQSNVPRQSMNDLIFESNIKTEDIEKQEEPSSIKQKDSIKNIKETPVKSNPWYIAQPDPPQKGSNQKPKFTDRYNKLTERFTEKGYIIKETLYRDPSLFYANSNSNVDSPSDNESNDNNWTDTFWQKHDNTDVPKHSKTSQSTRTVPRKNQNKLERSLNDMLAKPAEMSKGKSLLLKMGWQGGGLGREEDGIVEPIAPRATYAVKTIGLGHLTEKPEKPEKPKKPIPFANISNKKLKHPEFQSHFCTNVLLYILEFVKNDEENKIVFEPRLRKLERKRIHLIVEKIRESDNLEDFENFENFLEGHLELVKEIWVHNCYELWTESEGKKKNRRLCLFKEAPAHVYLVTPEDLTENDKKKDDVNDKNDDNDVNIKEEKDSEKIDGDNQDDSSNDTERDSDSNIIEENFKKDQGNEKFNSENTSQDIKKEISELTDSQMAVDSNMDGNNQILVSNENKTLEMTQKVKDSDFCCEIVPNMEISEVIMISSDESDSESTEMTTNDDLSHEIKPNNDKNVEIVEENQSSVQNENKVSEGVADINICTDIKFEIKIKEEYTKICEKMTQNDERTYHDYLNSYSGLFIKTENPRDEKGSILSKIVKYFKEFSTDETFKEFRFLGPFNSEQIMQINAFFKICMKQDNIENCYEKNDLLAAFDNGLVKFDVLEDNNGKRFIKKAGELPSEDEDEEVKYASGLYL